MDKTTPVKPKRAKRKPVTPPLTAKDRELFSEKENKYAPRKKIGGPTIGVPNRISKIGLGKLEVITAHGNINIQPE